MVDGRPTAAWCRPACVRLPPCLPASRLLVLSELMVTHSLTCRMTVLFVVAARATRAQLLQTTKTLRASRRRESGGMRGWSTPASASGRLIDGSVYRCTPAHGGRTARRLSGHCPARGPLQPRRFRSLRCRLRAVPSSRGGRRVCTRVISPSWSCLSVVGSSRRAAPPLNAQEGPQPCEEDWATYAVYTRPPVPSARREEEQAGVHPRKCAVVDLLER